MNIPIIKYDYIRNTHRPHYSDYLHDGLCTKAEMMADIRCGRQYDATSLLKLGLFDIFSSAQVNR